MITTGPPGTTTTCKVSFTSSDPLISHWPELQVADGDGRGGGQSADVVAAVLAVVEVTCTAEVEEAEEKLKALSDDVTEEEVLVMLMLAEASITTGKKEGKKRPGCLGCACRR